MPHLRMDFTDFLIIKLVVFAVAAFLYGFFIGPQEQEPHDTSEADSRAEH